jgi:hypothetical protein
MNPPAGNIYAPSEYVFFDRVVSANNGRKFVLRDGRRLTHGRPSFARHARPVRRQVSATRYLDTIDFSLFVEKVVRWSGEELSITIPSPERVVV